MILLIDNYDSFTWNLVHALARARPDLDPSRDFRIVRNDRMTVDQAEVFNEGRPPSAIVISPGPGTPADAGVSAALIQRFAGRIPILGVCLGHQTMGECGGMSVVRHSKPIHGKTSLIEHDGTGIFAGLPSPFRAARYHSLVIDAETLSPDWRVTAWTDEVDEAGTRIRLVMGLRREWGGTASADAHHTSPAPLEGVQFHPESFMTEDGERLLRNFLEAVAIEARRETPAAAGGSV